MYWPTVPTDMRYVQNISREIEQQNYDIDTVFSYHSQNYYEKLNQMLWIKQCFHMGLNKEHAFCPT